jgi:hypothetical protein
MSTHELLQDVEHALEISGKADQYHNNEERRKYRANGFIMTERRVRDGSQIDVAGQRRRLPACEYESLCCEIYKSRPAENP